MYKYSKILVGLDNSDMDKSLIRAASEVCKLSGSKSVYFVNVLKEMNLPDSIKREFPDILDKAIEERQNEIQDKVNKHFNYTEAEVIINVIVDEGQVTKTILKYAGNEKIDLVILGRKNEQKGGGIQITRIARRIACSLLIIPKGADLKLNKVLVPTDFSDYSKKAVEKAATLLRKSKNENAVLTIQNVYQVPVGYHYTGKSFKEFSEIMKDHAKGDYKKFVNEVDLRNIKLEQTYTLDKDDDITKDIYKTAKKIDADLIVIGAKGRTAAASLFIGSKAEKLIQVDSDIPLLVVRPKGKIAGLMEMLREI